MTFLRTVLLLCLLSCQAWADAPLRIGSKNFNESYLLAEIVAQSLEARGFAIERKFGLGGTLICYEALRNDEIDLYVEYTGTLSQAILGLDGNPPIDELNALLTPEQLTMLPPFGFNNTYALVVREDVARERGLERIGDLAAAADLELVFSHEFLERDDGWRGLSRAYGLSGIPRGIEHGLAYQAISEGAIGVTDAYSTDGELKRYALRVLADDRGYFPRYLAAPLVRNALPSGAQDVLREMAGSIDDATMQALNAEVVFEQRSFAAVAADFLRGRGVQIDVIHESIWSEMLRNTLRHLQLTAIALSAAVFLGLGVSLVVYRWPRISGAIIYLAGLMQTIPSIALLALMIPIFGIGMLPAVVALFLYSLLPILRNAITALTHVDPQLVKVSVAIGLSRAERLRHVLVPLSLPSIFAGIRTAAVISIGTATLAAFIGAGGLGDPIVEGLSLNRTDLIMQGALPAAALAIVTELVFEALEARLSRRR